MDCIRHILKTSVADPDPGSGIGCFFTPGSGIQNRFFPEYGVSYYGRYMARRSKGCLFTHLPTSVSDPEPDPYSVAPLDPDP